MSKWDDTFDDVPDAVRRLQDAAQLMSKGHAVFVPDLLMDVAAALTAWNRRAGGEVALREALESCITHMIGWPDPEDVAYCIDKARAALTQPSAAAGWRDIATAPRNGTPVDLWIGRDRDGNSLPKGFRGAEARFITGGEIWCGFCATYLPIQATHWQPPPEPPEPTP